MARAWARVVADGDFLAVLGAGDKADLEADTCEPEDVGGSAAGEVGSQRDLEVVGPHGRMSPSWVTGPRKSITKSLAGWS